MQRLIDAIPTNWLDPLLTGKNAVIGNPPYDCKDIERLLSAIRVRINSIASEGRIMMKGIEVLREQVKIARSDGNWNYDPYLHGMANGLVCALATMEGKTPEYLNAPSVWMRNIQNPTPTAQTEETA